MKNITLKSLTPYCVLALLMIGCQSTQMIEPTATPTKEINSDHLTLIPTEIQIGMDRAEPEIVAPLPTSTPIAIPYDFISQESLLGYLEDLTSIQPYSGWRNSASSGEAEALDYVEQTLEEFAVLESWGMELEREQFKVFLSTEFWETRLHLTIGDKEIEVPADGLRAARYSPRLASNLDSDGFFNDSANDPVTASGEPLIVNDLDVFYNLTADDVEGRILFLDYAFLDLYAAQGSQENGWQLVELIDDGLAGLVLVTQFSNKAGDSHGTVVGDGSTFQYNDFESHVPILYARMEDLAPAGISTWDDFSLVESARLTWDVDVENPGQSGNLIARIPGVDSSHAVILGAHIDSPNSPGAFDDGSGSAGLLEIARVLNQTQVQPNVDLYLAWFGGHEIGIYGSAHFVSTHQELLDRTLAMLQFDCLSHPLDGKSSEISFGMTSYGRFDNHDQPWPDFLAQSVAPLGLTPETFVEYGLIADNSNFDAFNVPNIDMIYVNIDEMHNRGSGYIHYSGHLHDPYETMALAQEVGDIFEDMTKVALAAALETGRMMPELRVPAQPEQRALFIGNHTEPTTMAPSMMIELGMALAWEGFDVDLIPYGQKLTPSDFENVGIAVLLPTMSYPGTSDNVWNQDEFALIEQYIAEGGFLVITNSSFNLLLGRKIEDRNENVFALNPFLSSIGIRFQYGALDGNIAMAVADHPLMEEAGYLKLFENNGVPVKIDSGLDLAQVNGRTIIGLVDYGNQGGQVLIISDLGILKDNGPGAKNMNFVKNIATYARLH